uniref:Uncharacterized protein n=1 Tax=Lepeophtheirus salmonis TaxID=72036 RepID=A0A0K2T3U3_LEPSM
MVMPSSESKIKKKLPNLYPPRNVQDENQLVIFIHGIIKTKLKEQQANQNS